jgi:two-component system, OmpR family, response regulator
MDALVLQALKILVVDDDRDSREMMVIALETEGAEVKSVESVQAALDALLDWQPNLVISDIRMPDADGYEFLAKLRDRNLTMPAIAVTAFARDDDRTAALEAGYARHLTKPIDLDLLYQTILGLSL